MSHGHVYIGATKEESIKLQLLTKDSRYNICCLELRCAKCIRQMYLPMTVELKHEMIKTNIALLTKIGLAEK